MDARELGLAIAEVAEWLRSCGIEASADDSYAGALPTEEALGMLRAFVDDAVGEGGLG